MIIGFYPGAGGNRYYWYLTGQRNFQPHTTYDHLLQNQYPAYRYLDQNCVGLDDRKVILTHCVNVPLMKQLFPNHKEYIVIFGNLNDCLKREWTLAEQYRDKNISNKFDHAIKSIAFHHRYYSQYPLDYTGATTVIDINTDHSEFAQQMQQEINSIDNLIFDQACDSFQEPVHNISNIPVDKITQGFKSKFLDDAETIKDQLDKYSPSLCLAKWKQVSLHLTTGMNNSCYHPPLHRIPIESIAKNPSALHNTAHKKEQRKMMLNGERPAECSYCWNMEDLGKLSDRHYRSGEPWASVDFGKIVSSNWDDDIVPSYVEVNFNHACNLKCSYCSPQFSSSWHDEAQREGPYPTAIPHNSIDHFVGDRRIIPVREHNPYVEAFWAWWPTLYPQLKHFRMTGGEPLMDKNTYKVFDYVLAMPNPDLHLNVTSNFSVEDVLFEKYLDYVKQLCNTQIEHFMQYVSLDTGNMMHAEYIRHGLDGAKLIHNVDRYLKEVPARNSLTFIITMNNLSVPGFQSLLEYILKLRQTHSTTYQRVWFDTPVLRTPVWQSLQILPESYAYQLEKAADFMEQNLETVSNPFYGFKDYEVQRLRRDIAWMREGQHQDNSQQKADFYRFFNEHDQRRGTDFLKSFPEMRAWWAECQQYAKKL